MNAKSLEEKFDCLETEIHVKHAELISAINSKTITEVSYLVAFDVDKIDKQYIYEALAERIKEAAPKSIKISQSMFLIGGYAALNEAQNRILDLLMHCEGFSVSFFTFRVSPPVFGTFSSDLEKHFGSVGLEPNNMRLK
jgi:hypothetical protein